MRSVSEAPLIVPDRHVIPAAMSRAFTKEIDDAPLPSPPERPVGNAPNYVTEGGAKQIEGMIRRLQQQIPDAAGHHATDLRRDLRYWLARKSSMHIVPANPAPVIVGFGVRITIMRGVKSSDIQIVGEDEASPRSGLIGWTSPLARALEGAVAGDVVELKVAGRIESVTVVAIAKPKAPT